jgi:2-C-methyl-D-erythritol 4-phosphate cytidylyltransferase
MGIAIILASGIGKRMGAGKNKVFLRIRNKPVIFYVLRSFENYPKIKKIIITSKADEIGALKKICQKYNFEKVVGIIPGGKERQDSAFGALRYIKENKLAGKNSVIIFHNGANPFVTKEEIGKSILEAKKHGACVVAHPSKDTIKEIAEDGMVVKTLERKKLWNMQTPQTIRFGLAFEAFSKASRDNFLGTDDVSLVERLGEKVKVIEGSKYNFKITTLMDLELAKIIIKKHYV